MARVARSLVLTAFVIFLIIMTAGFPADYSGIRIENAKDISQVIRNTLLHRSNSVIISFRAYTLDQEAADEAIEELVMEAFYESEAPDGGDYVHFQYGGYKKEYEIKKQDFKYLYRVRILPIYYTDRKQEDFVDNEVKKIISQAKMPNSDFEKIKWVHDYICNTVSYDAVHRRAAGSSHVQSTAYGALRYNTALCQGYAVLCYRLLKEIGIDCRIVTGNAIVSGESERHAWNLVKYGDAYYNMDVTLDDVNETYDYFLKSDKDFAADHERDVKYLTKEFCDTYPMGEEIAKSDQKRCF